MPDYCASICCYTCRLANECDEARCRLQECIKETTDMKKQASQPLLAAMNAADDHQQWSVASYAQDPKLTAALGCKR